MLFRSAFSRQLQRPLFLLTASPTALAELALRASLDSSNPRAVLNIDDAGATLLVSRDGAPLLTAEVPVGLRDFTTALMRPIIAGEDVIQLDEEQAVALRDEVGIPAADLDIEAFNIKGKNLLPLLEPALQRFAQQLTQWLTFAGTQENGARVEQLYLVGSGASMPGLADSLARRLKISVDSADWLAGIAGASSRGRNDIGAFAAACAAARFGDRLPDLMPPSERKRRRIARIRSSTTMAGPLVAAATLGIAFLFNQIGGRLSRAAGDVNMEMTRMQGVLEYNAQLRANQQATAALRGEFDAFAQATPNWIGLFKELSLVLPRELRVTRLMSKQDTAGMHLNIEGEVYASGSRATADEVVELALTALERSPFAKAVRLVNLSRGRTETGVVGTVAIELTLAYRRPEVRQPQ